MKTFRISVFCVIGIFTILLGSAFTPLSHIADDRPENLEKKISNSKAEFLDIKHSPCDLAFPSTDQLTLNDEQQAIVYEVPYGPQEDEKWLIINQWTEKDNSSNNLISYTLKQNLGKPQSLVSPNTTSCTYVANESLQSTQVVGGITQYLKIYYYRYNWVDSNSSYKAYWIYQTVEWWTRTATSYTVGQNATIWTYNGWNCSNVFSSNSNSGGFTPNWQTSSRTYDYIYDFTKNWVIKTPGPLIGFGNINVAETSPGYNNGSPIGTLSTQVRLYGL